MTHLGAASLSRHVLRNGAIARSRREVALALIVVTALVLVLTAFFSAPCQANAAIAQRGTPTTSNSTTTGVTISKPAGVVAGDVMIVNIVKHGNTTAATSSGWTQVAWANLGGRTLRNGTVLMKIAGASEPGQYTFSIGAVGTDPGCAAAIVAYSGVDNTRPIEATGTIGVAAVSNTVTAPTITTLTDNARVIMFGMTSLTNGRGVPATYSSWQTLTSPGALSEIYDYSAGGTSGNSVGAADATKATAGSTGAGRVTLASSTETVRANGGVLIALREGEAAPTTATVTTPADGSSYTTATMPASFSGEAADDAAGLGLNADSTTFTLQRSSDGMYWSGLSWQVAAFSLATMHDATTDGATVTWTRATGMPDWSLESDGDYVAQATATDKSSNTYTGSAVTFTLATPVDVTVTATGNDKTYDGTTDASVELTSTEIADGDDVTITHSAADFDTKDVGTGKPIDVVGIALSGADAGKYNLLNTTASTSADITALHITGDFTAENKVYDGTTDATVATRSLTGTLTGDVVTLDGGTATFADKSVADGITVTLSGATLGGADADNYILDSVGDTTADITLNYLVVTADDKSKVFGTADPALTYAITSGTLGSGDSFSGELTRTAGEAVGDYPITQGTLALDANYDLTVDPGTFTITPAATWMPVWRFRSGSTIGSYLWTPDPSEKASIIANLPTIWIYEGQAFRINTSNPTNNAPMWRFRNKQFWTYFYTADPTERDNLINTQGATWAYEGPAYKVSLAPTAVPVWRFRCLHNSTHLWTSDPNEKLTIETTLQADYALEGIAYYLGQ